MTAPKRPRSSKGRQVVPPVSETERAAPGGTGPEAGMLDGARVHLYRVAVGLSAKYEQRLSDPDYRPSPTDLSAIFAALRTVEEHAAGVGDAFRRIAELKRLHEELAATLRASEEKLLTLISTPPAK